MRRFVGLLLLMGLFLGTAGSVRADETLLAMSLGPNEHFIKKEYRTIPKQIYDFTLVSGYASSAFFTAWQGELYLRGLEPSRTAAALQLVCSGEVLILGAAMFKRDYGTPALGGAMAWTGLLAAHSLSVLITGRDVTTVETRHGKLQLAPGMLETPTASAAPGVQLRFSF